MGQQVLMIYMILAGINLTNARPDIPFNHIPIDYKAYINMVKSKNLEYAAEKLNVDISEAAVQAARIFQDPYFTLDLIDNRQETSGTGSAFESELIKPIDIAGERNARIVLTKSEKDLNSALLADFFRNLQADATLAYINGMKQKQLYMVCDDSYQTMKKLYESDSIRLKLGSIMEIDAIQSKLEAGTLLNELNQSLSEWKNSLASVSLMAGTANKDTFFLPSGHLHNVTRYFLLDSLIMTALENRADFQAALLNKDVAQKALTLTRKERRGGIDLKLGYANYFTSDGITPKTTGLTAGIGIPLKFSNLNKGEIKMAEIRIQQADELYRHAELIIRTEIIKALELYQNYCKQVQNYNTGLLENAENVRRGKIYSYQRGETSLLEVLNAQRTYNEIQTAYYETVFNQVAALIELEKAAGIWDISF